MDFTFRSFQSNTFGTSSIETAGSLASTQTAETAGSLAWTSDNGGVDNFVSSNPFAPSIDYSQYTSAPSVETAGSVACFIGGGDFGGASTVSAGGDCGGASAASCGGGGGFTSVC